MASYLPSSVSTPTRPRTDSRGREVPVPPARALLARPGRRHPGTPYLETLEAVEESLDQTWPDWRYYAPFGGVEVDHAKRIKWLLKRRDLLLQGRDWGVLLVSSVKDGGARWYAHPIIPPPGEDLRAEYYARRDLWEPPLWSAHPRHGATPSTTVQRLAGELAASPGDVAAVLATMPPGFTPDLWVKRHLKGATR